MLLWLRPGLIGALSAIVRRIVRAEHAALGGVRRRAEVGVRIGALLHAGGVGLHRVVSRRRSRRLSAGVRLAAGFGRIALTRAARRHKPQACQGGHGRHSRHTKKLHHVLASRRVDDPIMPLDRDSLNHVS